MPDPYIIYTAAHAHFPDTEPLGGGKAVADYLCRERPNWKILSPQSLGLALKKPLADMSELQYAKFCRQFQRACTAEILKQNPKKCAVLINDISEGPDFRTLGERGYRLATIWHVDVVEYFTKFYLRGLVQPATAARWSRFRHLPDMLKLVFHKQADCVRYCRHHIVPSAPMRDMILRCYPDCPAGNIVVLPWGNIATTPTAATTALPATEEEFVIMTLSRLSPEKGIERLLAALPKVTGQFRVWICGAPAYMKGKRYEQKLRRMAGPRVEFRGHVTGERKAALLQRADVFVSPSLHESYGLTIAEAEGAGCQIISHQHYGAKGRVVDCSSPRQLAEALNEFIRAGRMPKQLTANRSDAANQITALLAGMAAD
jgi:glycosyltransferase involved in cell wall biosynthesis